MKKIYLLAIQAVLFMFFPHPAFAHAFGTRYTVPIPFTIYFFAAAATLLISFIIIGVFVRQTKKDLSYPTKKISLQFFRSLFENPMFIIVAKTISVFLLLLTIATGFFGINDFEFNFNMTFFWIIFLLGMTYLTALIGNIYAVINPFAAILDIFAYIWNAPIQGMLAYPKKLGYYPALIFYVFLVWFELLGEVTPYSLSVILVIYTGITLIGAIVFGKKNWLEKAEFFSVFFQLIGYISPINYKDNTFFLRLPFMGLLSQTMASFSLLVFILFMLSSTAFDGFRETVVWGNLSTYLFRMFFSWFGDQTSRIIDTVFLLLSPFAFFVLYYCVLFITKRVVASSASITNLALRFAYSLIPIALVYNISHYYTLFVIQGQEIIRLISDPFGLNWNLFGTNTFIPSNRLLSTNFIWQSEVVFLLGGHVVAVYISHLIALRIFPSHKQAVMSQFPMLFLMVMYTVLGLWILSQPLSVGK